MAELISAGTIHGRLNAIDEHAYSAEKYRWTCRRAWIRVWNWNGSLSGKFGKIPHVTDQKRNFKALCNDENHKHGMRSVYSVTMKTFSLKRMKGSIPIANISQHLPSQFPVHSWSEEGNFKRLLIMITKSCWKSFSCRRASAYRPFEYQRIAWITFFHESRTFQYQECDQESITITHPNQKCPTFLTRFLEPKTIVRARGIYWLPHFDNVEKKKFVGNKAKNNHRIHQEGMG